MTPDTKKDKRTVQHARNPKRLPKEATNVIADAKNDITIPFFTDVLRPVDDTLIKRGGSKGLAIYDEIERDTHASSVLQKRKQGLVAREWQVEPGGLDAQDLDAAELVEDVLRNLPFDRICEDLLDATLKGFAISEIVWHIDGNHILPKEIVSHDQRRFVFDLDWRPRLLTMTNQTNGLELPDRKFIVHRHGVKGNNPYGLGLGSKLFWPVLFKREGITFWLTFLEKFASPTVVGKTPYGLGDNETNALLNSLEGIVQNSAITLPMGVDVNFLEPARSGNVSYQDWVSYWDNQMSIGTLGETLTTDIGDKGSRAAAETHADVREYLIDADGDLLSDTLRTSLLQWIVDLNLPGAKAPKVWRVRAANELEQAELKDKQATATVKKNAALMTLVSASNIFEKDDEAKRFVQELYLGSVDDEVLDALIAKRFEVSVPDVNPDTLGFSDNGSQVAKSKKKDLNSGPKLGQVAFGHSFDFSEETETMTTLVEQVQAALIPNHTKKLGEIKAAFAKASDLNQAAANLLDLQGEWAKAIEVDVSPIAQALTLARLHGREAVLNESLNESQDDDETDFADDKDWQVINQPFQEQLDYFNSKTPKPSKTWLDMAGQDHDRAFVIAGVTNTAMLTDFQKAIGRALKDGLTLKDFRKDFDAIVAKYGWDYKGTRDWRSKVIFETNVRTSYMAGRLKQMRDPAVLKLLPYWEYVHGQTRKPKSPRAQHQAWDGLILPADDPWFQKHFPPNGFNCSCGVRSLSKRDLARRNRSEPDKAPDLGDEVHQLKNSDDLVKTPKGVGLGWDHQPGNLWAQGFIPRQIKNAGGASERGKTVPASFVPIGDTVEPLGDLLSKAKPFKAKVLPDNKAPDFYADKFRKGFGLKAGQATLFKDKSDEKILISDRMWHDDGGKVSSDNIQRLTNAAILAETLIDPDEIWLGVRDGVDSDRVLDRRYVRVDPKTGLMAIVEFIENLWTGKTAVHSIGKNITNSDASQIDKRRGGKLLFKRQ